MKIKWTLLLIYLLFNSVHTAISAEKIYRWVDEHGKVHYGDKPKNKDEDSASVFKKKDVQSIDTKKIKNRPIYIPPNNRYRSSQAPNAKINMCKNLNTQINQLNDKLRQRLSPGYFESTKNRLRELRARRLKQC